MKMKSHLCCSVVSIFTVLYCHRVLGLQCGPQELLNGEGQCVPCLQCPAGEEPDQYCSSSNDQEAQCRACAVGTFSDSLSSWPCRAHSWCENLNRAQLSPGTSTTDAVCGDCLHGFFDTEGMSILINECLPCAMAPVGTAACEDVQDLVPKILHSTGKNTPKLVVSVATNGTIASLPEEKNTEYAVFALVPIFCIMGLLGILICNVLKKKGYHCMTEKEASDEQSSMQEKDGKQKKQESNALTSGKILFSHLLQNLLLRFSVMGIGANLSRMRYKERANLTKAANPSEVPLLRTSTLLLPQT